MDSTPAAGHGWLIDNTDNYGADKKGKEMTDKEKATGVLPVPEVAIQKTDSCSVVAPPFGVNRIIIVRGTMLDAMRGAGLVPLKALDLQDDGKVHRFRIEGDKPGSSNGWYVLHSHPVQAGAFGSWKTGETHTWREATSKPPTAAERAEMQRHMQAMQQARAAEQELVHLAARERAEKLWRLARPADNSHPYLQRKKVQAFGVRQLRESLLLPLRDSTGALHSLQFIGPEGSKRFLTGGRISGCYFALGRPVDSLLLCEGFATAAALHQATGRACAVAFNCGNLMAVARALRLKFPRMGIVVAADNDFATPGNPGVAKATEAARAVRGFVVLPRFKGGAQ